jgi:regulator of RNase E activity RraA
MIVRITTPERAGDRDQAREIVSALAADLSGNVVVLDCGALVVGTPSFLDEILKQVLVERGANALEVHGASRRAQEHLERSATNRDVQDRLAFAMTL